MRRRFAVLGVTGALVAAAALFAVVPSEESLAASPSSATFIIPADDSYGVAECTDTACGKVIADQWCAAQGFGASVAFGPAEATETTGSIFPRVRAASPDRRPVSITCSR